jgi:hypothetical protein
VKAKEPNKTYLSAAESPIPLPPVQDAWLEMRKKLDEAMPEGRSSGNGKRLALLSMLLLLPLSMLRVIDDRSAGKGVQGKASAGTSRQEGRVTMGLRKEAGITDGHRVGEGIAEGRREREAITEDQRKGEGITEGSHKGERTGVIRGKEATAIGRTGEDPGMVRDARMGKTGLDRKKEGTVHAGENGEEGLAQKQDRKNSGRPGGKVALMRTLQGEGNDRPGEEAALLRTQHEGKSGRSGKEAATRTGGRTGDNELSRVIVDAKPARPVAGGVIEVNVNMPRSMAGTEKKNGSAPKSAPKKSKRATPGDSTRLLWAAGLQDSKSFPLGSQQSYDYNVNLKNDIWSDYIPSPYFQYHVSRKIALQAAIQLNNPQYTESVTIYRQSGPVVNNVNRSGGFSLDTTVSVKKLYYFNIPLTVFYQPVRNVYLGAGLQFSDLSNGIAFQNSVIHQVGVSAAIDTVTSYTVIRLKDDRPAYNNLKKADWRALFEADYYWKRITLGLQYQEALSDYLYTPVDGSPGKDRNSSLRLYLRYNIWERRIKIRY